MEITAALVKELRDRSGVGMMECKKALVETGGNLDKAFDYLRKAGAAKALKKEGREAKEGIVLTYIHPGSKLGVLLELNCETDFVAKTEDFTNLGNDIAMHIAATDPLAVSVEDISNEISITSGYDYNNKNSVTAISGKNKYKFDIIQENFAWMTDNNFEKKMIKIMQKGSRIMVKAHNLKGSQTIDHYSLLGFTKAYKATKANCS